MKLENRIYLNRILNLTIWSVLTSAIITFCDLTAWPILICLALSIWQFIEQLFLTYKAFLLVRNPFFYLFCVQDLIENKPPRKTEWKINGRSIKEVPGTYEREKLEMWITFPSDPK